MSKIKIKIGTGTVASPHSQLRTPHSIPALIYGRVSTDKQDMERQDYLLETYCRRHGLEIIGRFFDPDVSGSIDMLKRPEGAKLMAALEVPGAGCQVSGRSHPDTSHLTPRTSLAVVTTDQDRIGRDVLDIVGTIRRIWSAGATPHFAAEGGALLRTPENEMIMGIKASTAQYLRDKIKSNIRGKFAAKRAANELCGTVPYGKNAVLTGSVSAKGVPIQRLEDNPEEQRWLRHMHALRTAGLSYDKIAKELNRLGAPTKRGKGEVMRLRTRGQRTEDRDQPDSDLRPRTSDLRFTSGRWQCGNVAKVLNSAATQAWLLAQCEGSGAGCQEKLAA